MSHYWRALMKEPNGIRNELTAADLASRLAAVDTSPVAERPPASPALLRRLAPRFVFCATLLAGVAAHAPDASAQQATVSTPEEAYQQGLADGQAAVASGRVPSIVVGPYDDASLSNAYIEGYLDGVHPDAVPDPGPDPNACATCSATVCSSSTCATACSTTSSCSSGCSSCGCGSCGCGCGCGCAS